MSDHRTMLKRALQWWTGHFRKLAAVEPYRSPLDMLKPRIHSIDCRVYKRLVYFTCGPLTHWNLNGELLSFFLSYSNKFDTFGLLWYFYFSAPFNSFLLGSLLINGPIFYQVVRADYENNMPDQCLYTSVRCHEIVKGFTVFRSRDKCRLAWEVEREKENGKKYLLLLLGPGSWPLRMSYLF